MGYDLHTIDDLFSLKPQFHGKIRLYGLRTVFNLFSYINNQNVKSDNDHRDELSSYRIMESYLGVGVIQYVMDQMEVDQTILEKLVQVVKQ